MGQERTLIAGIHAFGEVELGRASDEEIAALRERQREQQPEDEE